MKCIVMEKRIPLVKFIILVLFLSVLPTVSRGQYFNYAMAYTAPNPTKSSSLIRTIDDTSAVVYYYDYGLGRSVIAQIGLNMSCRKALLPENCKVNDMRITGNNVYFCGSVDATPVIGHIKLSDFATTPRHITLYKADNFYVSSLNRMAAYTIGGKQKVVMVGELIYTDSAPSPLICPYYYYSEYSHDSIPFYYYNCSCSIILEVDFQDENYLSDHYLLTDSNNHSEVITEVVETQNFVAFVGFFNNHHTTIFHNCDKNNVVNSFYTYQHYCVYVYNGGLSRYHGCLMNGDTIAVSSLSTYTDTAGMQQFSTNIRMFDLQTMDNTSSFKVLHNTKTEPLDMLYMIKNHQLVLLQDMYIPSSSNNQCAFLHVDPYAPYTYNAKCWYESNRNLPFNSLSRLNDTTYVASGGNYWCMKDVEPFVLSNCYKTEDIEVRKINVYGNAPEHDPYRTYSNIITYFNNFEEFDNENMTPDNCIEP